MAADSRAHSRGSTSSSSPGWPAARSASSRSRCHRRCQPRRPPPQELPQEPEPESSRAEAAPPSAGAPANAAPPELGRGHPRPRPRPATGKGRGALQIPSPRPALSGHEGQWESGKGAELCGTWSLPRRGRGRDGEVRPERTMDPGDRGLKSWACGEGILGTRIEGEVVSSGLSGTQRWGSQGVGTGVGVGKKEAGWRPDALSEVVESRESGALGTGETRPHSTPVPSPSAASRAHREEMRVGCREIF